MPEEKDKVEEVKEQKVSSVEEYRKMSGRLRTVTVPSGLVFQLKRLTPIDYIREGLSDIPNEFFEFIGEMEAGKIPDPKEEKAQANFDLFERFLNVTVEKGIISPPVVMKYTEETKDTHLVYWELEAVDQKCLVDEIIGKTKVSKEA